MEPTLRVLVSVADDADVLVYDQELDVAGAALLDRGNGDDLVLRNVPEPMEVLLSGRGEE